MSFKYLALTLASSVLADPSITIKEDGADKKLYVVGSSWAPPQPSTTGFGLPHSGRVYLGVKDGNGGFSPDMFYAPNLLGGSIEYDFDLS